MYGGPNLHSTEFVVEEFTYQRSSPIGLNVFSPSVSIYYCYYYYYHYSIFFSSSFTAIIMSIEISEVSGV